MKKYGIFCLGVLLLLISGMTIQAQQNPIQPPKWIQGEWQSSEGGQIFSLGMKADDIIWDGSSLREMLRTGMITFSQKETSSGYEMYFQFLSDKYWYREVFTKPMWEPTIKSSFTDSEGTKKQYTYSKKAAVAAEPRPPQTPVQPTQPVQPASPPAPQPVTPPTPAPVVAPVAPPAAPAASSRENEMRGKITATARKYLGATYIYGAQNPPQAFDCSGFVGQAYKEGANVVLPRTSKVLATTGAHVNRNNIKPGDIIYFDINGYGVISHVALVLDSGNMIHAVAEGKGMAITSLNDKWYAPKIAGYRNLFSGGEVSLSGSIRDGISIRARGADRPLSEIFIEITNKPEKSTDEIRMAMETGLHFTLINKTGRDADFDVFFYQKGTARDRGDHERISVKANTAKELVNAFFAEKAGQYTVEVRKAETASALVEKTWIVE